MTAARDPRRLPLIGDVVRRPGSRVWVEREVVAWVPVRVLGHSRVTFRRRRSLDGGRTWSPARTESTTLKSWRDWCRESAAAVAS